MALIARLAKIACSVETTEDFLTVLVTISLPSGRDKSQFLLFSTVLRKMTFGAAYNNFDKIPFNANEQ